MELSEKHMKMLTEDSGISEEIIHARGYRTVEKKVELESRGFSKPQRNVPGLLIPILAAGVSLGAASIALAKKIEVEPRPGWVEPVVLWILTLLPSGETVASAKIIAVSADTNLVADFAARMLHSQEETEGDPVVERLDTGRRQALRLITEEADTKDNGCTDEK